MNGCAKLEDAMTIIIADQDVLAREGLRSMLESEGLSVVADAWEEEQLISQSSEYRPNVVILEASILVDSGMDLIDTIKHASPNTRVILMGTSTNPDTIICALQRGLDGYIEKTASSERFQMACLHVVKGDGLVLPDTASDLFLHLIDRRTTLSSDENVRLTKRQLEVLGCMVEGMSNKQIGTHLNLSETTIKSHVTAILRKLGAADRTQAVAKAIFDRIVKRDDA